MKKIIELDNSIDIKLKKLDPWLFNWILYYSGYHKREYTDYIGRSKSFLHNCIFKQNDFVQTKYVENLIKLIGADNYKICHKRALEKRERIKNQTKLS